VLGFPCVVSGIETDSERDQARACASRAFLTITKLARANITIKRSIIKALPKGLRDFSWIKSAPDSKSPGITAAQSDARNDPDAPPGPDG
jgi:hypothetical protein